MDSFGLQDRLCAWALLPEGMAANTRAAASPTKTETARANVIFQRCCPRADVLRTCRFPVAYSENANN